MKISEISSNIRLYHGTDAKQITKFNRPAHGVFFTPHKDWAQEHYGNNIISVFLRNPRIYKIQDEKFLDALFDRDYPVVAWYVTKLASEGYDAAQTSTDSEMVVVFPNTPIYQLGTGKLM